MTTAPTVRTLRKYLPRKRIELCDLCGAGLPPRHRHLLAREGRRIVCACDACSVLFPHRDASTYLRIPEKVRRLEAFQMSDAEWDSLCIPIGLAYFSFSSTAGRTMAFYPGPAGPTESLLELSAWNEIGERNPMLGTIEPDVEALLVNRVGGARDYYLIPIDRCYRLAGLIRMLWRGFSGGEEVWSSIANFFQELQEDARA